MKNYIVASLMLTAPIPAFGEAWSAMAIDGSTAVKCHVSTTQADYDSTLTMAGWSKYGNRPPQIDFTSQVVAVIAPGTFRADSVIKYVSTSSGKNGPEIEWDFRKVPAPVIHEGVTELSSSAPPGPEVLVVAMDLKAAVGVTCTGPY